MGEKQTFDGRRVTMGLMGPLDLYRKLRWESKMIDQLAIPDGVGAIYCALNAAISAWQLGDWIAVALAHDQRWPLAAAHLGATKMQTKQDLQAEMRKCDALLACQQIATAGKHLNIVQGTFRDGFRADYYVDYHRIEPETEGGEGLEVRKAALSVVFPSYVDAACTVRKQQGMGRVLSDASDWWEQLLRATDYWVEGAELI